MTEETKPKYAIEDMFKTLVEGGVFPARVIDWQVQKTGSKVLIRIVYNDQGVVKRMQYHMRWESVLKVKKH